MDYLRGIEGRNSNYADRLACASLINENSVLDFFRRTGYDVRNNSIYRIANLPTVTPQSHFRIGTDFIASHTLLSRLKQDLGYHLFSSLKIKSVIDDYVFHLQRTNNRLLERLSKDVAVKAVQPKFVYTHTHMPHYPYYYKADGSTNAEAGNPVNAFDKNDYVGYLQYSNAIYLQVIDNILQHSAKPPVIIFMGDHGFREFQAPTAVEKQAYFMNLNAVYLPNGDYSRFYKGMSGVNQFRVILNTTFGQQLPLLKDSTSFLSE
jgi:hypothetical protein